MYVYSMFTGVTGWYKLGALSQWVYQSDFDTCSIAVNDWDKNFFIPTRSTREVNAFESHTPGDISLSSASQPVCATDGRYDCTVWTDTFHAVPYRCGVGNSDMCYEWKCNTECGNTDCDYVDVGWCFIKGTMITLSNGNIVPVETVSTGDVLLGWTWSQNTVKKLYKIFYKRRLFSLNGSDYFVSDSHPFMTTDGWKSFDPNATLKENPDMIVSTLEVWDILVTDHGLVKLLSVSSKRSPQYVYNFKTNGNHTYYADGYLVHNPNIKAQ